MSRYTLLVLFNLPIITAGFINALVSYKMKRMSRRRFIVNELFWVAILVGLLLTEPLYAYLYSHGLTDTDALSLFDVVAFTGIIFTLFVANQAFSRADRLEQRLHSLHQEISIRLSEDRKSKK